MLNLKRLALALFVVVPSVAAMLYFFVPREADASVRDAKIVETPGGQGRKLGLQAGEMAPNFEVSTHDGRRVKLSDFRGKVFSTQVLRIADWRAFWAARKGRSLKQLHDELRPLVKAYWDQHGTTQNVP